MSYSIPAGRPMPPPKARRGFFPGWTVVGGSGVGIAFGTAMFVSSSFALLASALSAQFGWSQSDLAKAASIVLLLQIVMNPVLGWMLDRWGSRKVGSASIVGFALALLYLSRIGNSLTEFYIAFLLIGLLATGTNVVAYARAITLWFDRKRGLALGVASGCQAVGAFVMPIVMQKIIAASGWTQAILTLAGFELLICLPLVALLVKDDPRDYGWNADGDAEVHAATAALRAGAAPETSAMFRTGNFWKLALGFAIMGMCTYAWTTNVTFILTRTAGLSLAKIAAIQGITGIAFLAGRVVFGYLLDRFHAPRLAIGALVLMAAFYLIVGTATAPAAIIFGALLFGLSAGGEGDLLPYLAGRYFGARAVSKVFGWFLCAYFAGAAIGPVAFAQASAWFQGPTTTLYAMAALQVVPVLLFLALGPYRRQADATGH
ncbi:MAG: MFS transporter [Burkholderiales bacterium]|nr:MFS transporter [Burkholderiales bacterium]